MIDWFASKLGLLIFIALSAAALTAFSLAFAEGFRQQSDAAAATDIARLIDGVADGMSVNYSVPLSNYTLTVSQHVLSLNGVERSFAATAAPSSIASARVIAIRGVGGVVHVSAA